MIVAIWGAAWAVMIGLWVLAWRSTKPGEKLMLLPSMRNPDDVYVSREVFILFNIALAALSPLLIRFDRHFDGASVADNAVFAVLVVLVEAASVIYAVFPGRGLRLKKEPPPLNLDQD